MFVRVWLSSQCIENPINWVLNALCWSLLGELDSNRLKKIVTIARKFFWQSWLKIFKFFFKFQNIRVRPLLASSTKFSDRRNSGQNFWPLCLVVKIIVKDFFISLKWSETSFLHLQSGRKSLFWWLFRWLKIRKFSEVLDGVFSYK